MHPKYTTADINFKIFILSINVAKYINTPDKGLRLYSLIRYEIPEERATFDSTAILSKSTYLIQYVLYRIIPARIIKKEDPNIYIVLDLIE